jgi:hypothetical protein
MFAFAPLNTYLMSIFTWQEALLIVAGITANGLVCGALYRQLQPTEAQVDQVAEIALKHVHTENTDAQADDTNNITVPNIVLSKPVGYRHFLTKIQLVTFSRATLMRHH